MSKYFCLTQFHLLKSSHFWTCRNVIEILLLGGNNKYPENGEQKYQRSQMSSSWNAQNSELSYLPIRVTPNLKTSRKNSSYYQKMLLSRGCFYKINASSLSLITDLLLCSTQLCSPNSWQSRRKAVPCMEGSLCLLARQLNPITSSHFPSLSYTYA